MSLSPEEVKKIAHLARINIDEAETSAYQKDLSNILHLVEKMTVSDDVEPLSHPFDDLAQPLREDVVSESNQRDAFQAIAPDTEHGLYKVNKVIE